MYYQRRLYNTTVLLCRKTLVLQPSSLYCGISGICCHDYHNITRIITQIWQKQCHIKSYNAHFMSHKRNEEPRKVLSKCNIHLTCYHGNNIQLQSCCGYHTSTRSLAKDSAGEGHSKGHRTKPPWRVCFFGTSLVAMGTLRALHNNFLSSGSLVKKLEIVSVTPKESSRRKSIPVHKFATKNNLTLHEWPLTLSSLEDEFDVGILVSFGHLIPQKMIKLFPYGIINMHPSILPRWRGASPIFYTVLHGDTEAGVSILDIRPKHFDEGPVLMQRRVQVPPRVTSIELYTELSHLGAEMILECLEDLPSLERQEKEQEPQGVTYAHKFDPEQGTLINWAEQTPEEIDCLFRAFQDFKNSQITSHMHDGLKVGFLKMVDPALTSDLDQSDIKYRWGDFLTSSPGCVAFKKTEEWLLVKCKDGVVGFTEVKCNRRFKAKQFFIGLCNHKDVQCVLRSEDNELNKYIYERRVPK